MRLVRLFRIKNNVSAINRFITNLQLAEEDNRIINIQIVGGFAFITASVELELDGSVML